MRYLSFDLTRLRNSDTWAEAHKHPWMGLACHNLWYAAADRDGEGIPDDDDVLARLAGVKKSVWKKIREKVLKSWKLSDGKWTHSLIISESERLKAASEYGKQGAKKRWKKAENSDSVDRVPIDTPQGPPIRVEDSPPNALVLSSTSHSQVSKGGKLPIDRLAKALRLDMAKLQRLPKFSTFPGLMAEWVEKGCDPDKDIWPTIERIAKGRSDIASPRFFEQAILEARDTRLASQPSDRERWETRVASYRSHKFWAPQWGPPPDEPGCQAPADLLTPA